MFASVIAVGGPLLAQGFRDDFDKPTLDARWQWRTPAAGPTYSLTANPGHLRVTAPQRQTGFNHWVMPPRDAPLLLHEVPDCDFTFEGRVKLVDYGEGSNFHLALVAAESEGSVVAWGPFYARQLWQMQAPQVWLERTGWGKEIAAEGDARDVWLRLDETGGVYTFALKRAAGAEWQVAGHRHTWFEPKLVGFMAKTFGNGPAVTVDLDYLALETRPADGRPLGARLRVEATSPGTSVDRNLLGYFIEHLGRCIYDGGLWAEMLRNRKFVGNVSDADNAGPDGALEHWRRFGSENGVELARDNVTFYTGSQSQRGTSRDAKGEHGVAQDGLELRPIGYVGRVVLRQVGSEAPVRVSLRRGDRVLAKQVLSGVGGEWRTFPFELSVSAGGPATFALTTDAASGTLWIGCASLMPADNVDGMRADLVAAIRELKPPIIRWPGGNFASGYHWQDGLGDRDLRPARFDRAWSAWDTNDFGTHEFLRFCELVGCEPYVCLNAGEALAEEAAAWVEYCNGPADSPQGKRRAANGSAQPFAVKYWGLGNELYGSWQLGHLTPANYARKATEFAQAVRAVDPTVKLVGVGVDGAGWNDWNATVAKGAGKAMDYLSAHLYHDVPPEGDPLVNYRLAKEAPERFERVLAETARIAANGRRSSAENAPGGKPLPLAVDEWNLVNRDAWNGQLLPEGKLREGLFAARMFNVFLRLSDRVRMANIALLVNAMGVIQTDQTQVALTPVYWVFRLYGEHLGDRCVPVHVEPVEPCRPSPLDVAATLSADGRTLFLATVNSHPTRAVRGSLDLAGFQPAGPVRVAQMTGPHVHAANALGKPSEVAISESDLPPGEARDFVFPARSVTVLTFAKG